LNGIEHRNNQMGSKDPGLCIMNLGETTRWVQKTLNSVLDTLLSAVVEVDIETGKDLLTLISTLLEARFQLLMLIEARQERERRNNPVSGRK